MLPSFNNVFSKNIPTFNSNNTEKYAIPHRESNSNQQIFRQYQKYSFSYTSPSKAQYQQQRLGDSKAPGHTQSITTLRTNQNQNKSSNNLFHPPQKQVEGETRKKFLCIMPGCAKKAKLHYRCVAHGGVRTCSVDGCNKHVVTRGVCINHGGGKKCSIKLCTSAARKGGLCWSHGGKQYCTIEGCQRGPKSGTGGLCAHHTDVYEASRRES